MDFREEEANRQLFLDHLTAGDEVAVRVRVRFSEPSWYLTRVTRTTPTQISVTNNYGRLRKFRRSGGGLVGERYGDELHPVTEKIRADIRNASVSERFRSLIIHNEKNLTTEERAAMLAAYDAIHTEKT